MPAFPATAATTAANPSSDDRAAALATRYVAFDGPDLLRPLIEREFAGRIAVVSSFGAESALVLHLVAAIDPATPVIFLDTGQHFPETLAYRDELSARLGLRDVRTVRPEPAALRRHDPDDALWQHTPDLCCRLRKVYPLRHALAGFDAWITGRKRLHGDARAGLVPIEAADGRIKINPLAHWDTARIAETFASTGLPRHPLVADGYDSIGCAPCTRPTCRGEAPRAGRWAGSGKTECGIHWPGA